MIKVNIGVVGGEASYFGVYSNTENINKDFLESHFDSKNSPLFKCDPNGEAQDTFTGRASLFTD